MDFNEFYDKDYQSLCMHCMKEKNSTITCLNCGASVDIPQRIGALSYLTILHDRYLIGYAKGVSGQGLVYTALDLLTDTVVNVTEYMPTNICKRADDGRNVGFLSSQGDVFRENLNAFLDLYQKLSSLDDNKNLERYYDTFCENNTYYAVSVAVSGQTLKDFVFKNNAVVNWQTIENLFYPMLDTLIMLYDNNLYHYDISDETLIVTEQNSSLSLVLTDFKIKAVHQKGSALPVSLCQGAAAIEQYSPNYELSEKTDVYGFCCSFLSVLTGKLPSPSELRVKDQRVLISTSVLKKVPSEVVSMLSAGLKVDFEKRLASFKLMKEKLNVSEKIESGNSVKDTKAILRYYEEYDEELSSIGIITDKHGNIKKENPFAWLFYTIPIFVLAIIAAIVILIIFLNKGEEGEKVDIDTNSNASQIFQNENNFNFNSTSTIDIPRQNEIKAPEVIGLTIAEAQAKASPEGFFVVMGDPIYAENIDNGLIAKQENDNTTITVHVSLGKPFRTLPTIENKTENEATIDITAVGLKVLAFFEASDTVEEGKCIGYKNHSAGQSVMAGTTVEILISSGPQYVRDIFATDQTLTNEDLYNNQSAIYDNIFNNPNQNQNQENNNIITSIPDLPTRN